MDVRTLFRAAIAAAVGFAIGMAAQPRSADAQPPAAIVKQEPATRR